MLDEQCKLGLALGQPRIASFDACMIGRLGGLQFGYTATDTGGTVRVGYSVR